jgi:hypothetical protein
MKKIRVPSLPKVVKQHTNGHPRELSLPELEQQYSQAIKKTNVEEVWFAGAHCGMSTSLCKNHWDVLSVMQTSGVDLSKMAPVIVWRAFRYGG